MTVRGVLASVMREGNRLSIDARSSLELPHCLPGIRIDGDEFTGFFAGEEQSATRGYDGRPMRMVEQGRAPTRFGGNGVGRIDKPDGLSELRRSRVVLDKLVARPAREWCTRDQGTDD